MTKGPWRPTTTLSLTDRTESSPVNNSKSSSLSNPRLEAALEYASAGFPVIRLHAVKPAPAEIVARYHAGALTKGEAQAHARCGCGKPECHSPGKHPIAEGVHDAATDADTIRKWWEKSPDANVGIVMPEGTFAVDFDVRVEGVRARYDAFAAEMPATLVQQSGDGGEHWLYSGTPEGARFASRLDGLPGVDIIRHGHRHLVAAPSVHWTGAVYEWTGDREIAPAPAALLARVAAGQRPTERARPLARADTGASTPELDARIGAVLGVVGDAREHQGQRWYLCGAIGGVLRKLGWKCEDAELLITRWLSTVPGCDVRNGVRYALGAWDKDATEVSGDYALGEHLTEARVAAFTNAARLPRMRLKRESEMAANDTDADDTGPHGEPAGERVSAGEHKRTFESCIVELTDNPESPVFLVPALELGPGRPFGVIGATNVTKTLGLMQLEVDVALGRPVFGRFALNGGARNVLHLAYEGAGKIAEDFARLLRACGSEAMQEAKSRLRWARNPPPVATREKGGMVFDYDALCRVTPEGGLLVIDPLVVALRGFEENAAEVCEPIYELERVSDATGATIIIAHHMNAAGDRARGHSSIEGAFGSAAEIRKEELPRHHRAWKCRKQYRYGFDEFTTEIVDTDAHGAPTQGAPGQASYAVAVRAPGGEVVDLATERKAKAKAAKLDERVAALAALLERDSVRSHSARSLRQACGSWNSDVWNEVSNEAIKRRLMIQEKSPRGGFEFRWLPPEHRDPPETGRGPRAFARGR
jgi:hypothetical protein